MIALPAFPARAASARPSPSAAQMRRRATYRNLTLWTLQGWLAMFFIGAGFAKLTEPMDNLVALMGWPAVMSESFVRGVGMTEVALALGLLAPLISWKLGRPVLLTAAVGLLTLQAVMFVVHAIGLDLGLVAVNLALLAATAAVFWGRRH